MTILKKWTLFEKEFLLSSILALVITSIICKSDILTTACSITGIITVLLLAKGNNLGQVLGILLAILYSIVSYKNKYYGEALTATLFMLPMFVTGVIEWAKHKNNNTDSVEINYISKKEGLIILSIIPLLFMGIYYVLYIFNTNELMISTISSVSNLLGIYLQIRRSKSSFVFYMLNDIIIIILWGIPVMNKEFLLLPMFLHSIILCINDIYGLYNWKKLAKLQETFDKIVNSNNKGIDKMTI